MIEEKIQKNSGFVILFAVTISSILLAIALGVSNIALKEIKFGTSAIDTNDAFFAADTGIELVLLNDKNVEYPTPAPGTVQNWNETIDGLGSSGVSCAKISIYKDNTNTSIPVITRIVSKGYNIGDQYCESTNTDRIERVLEASY